MRGWFGRALRGAGSLLDARRNAAAAPLFPRFDPARVRDALEAWWDFSHGLPLPRARARRCPACGSGGAIPRVWGFHERGGSDWPWRCDVGLKCTACGHGWSHGLVITEDVHARFGGRVYDRREARRLLEAQGWREGSR